MIDSTSELAPALANVLATRHSTRRLASGPLPQGLIEDLTTAAQSVPSAFNAQPWRVVVLHRRNADFWKLVEQTIGTRLSGERAERYLMRAAGMRDSVVTILIFEDLTLSDPRDGVTESEARDQASQGLGMLQLALWLTVAAHGLTASLQHWHSFLEDGALRFVGLPKEGFRLVTFMPVGYELEAPLQRSENLDRVALEQIGPEHYLDGAAIWTYPHSGA